MTTGRINQVTTNRPGEFFQEKENLHGRKVRRPNATVVFSCITSLQPRRPSLPQINDEALFISLDNRQEEKFISPQYASVCQDK